MGRGGSRGGGSRGGGSRIGGSRGGGSRIGGGSRGGRSGGRGGSFGRGGSSGRSSSRNHSWPSGSHYYGNEASGCGGPSAAALHFILGIAFIVLGFYLDVPMAMLIGVVDLAFALYALIKDSDEY